jgi:hypothetical protein
MKKATKATKQRLQKEDFSPRVRISTILEYIVREADRAEYETETKAFYSESGLYYRCNLDEVNLFRGLQSKYPDFIQTTLTHGLNEIIIPDINKLVKEMLINR